MTVTLPVLLLAAGLFLVPATPAESRLLLVTARAGNAGTLHHPSRFPRRLRVGVGRGTVVRKPLIPVAAGLPVACLLAGFAGWPVAVAAAVTAGGLCHRLLRPRQGERTEPLRLAAGWDLLAAGLRAGLPVPVTVRAVAAELTGGTATALLEVADSLALVADPVSAWEPALRDPDTAEIARAARRAARTGSGLAGVADGIAAQARESVGEHAQARAQRATVWVSAPLGLCFLPAFLCLGVAPVVVGMLGRLM